MPEIMGGMRRLKDEAEHLALPSEDASPADLTLRQTWPAWPYLDRKLAFQGEGRLAQSCVRHSPCLFSPLLW